ncbi:MAG: ATP/GTP-binding protein [Leptolyngbyaceae cyanobacterium]
MEVMRVVVTGPVGAGKSTFIRNISEITAVNTDCRATDETARLKQDTTVAMDFGRLQFNPQMVLHLYGTPGQSRFNFMWDMLIRKAHAYIVLVPSHQPMEFRQAKVIMNFMQQRTKAPMIIGLTHGDCQGAWSSENVVHSLGYYHSQILPTVIPVNANNKQSVAKAVLTLVRMLAQQMRAREISQAQHFKKKETFNDPADKMAM